MFHPTLPLPHPSTARLHDRIHEVHLEKSSRRKEIADLRARHKLLKKALVAKQVEIDAERARCEQVQMLKLGRVIDPEILDQINANQGAVKLQQKLAHVEAECDRELAAWDRKDAQVCSAAAAAVAVRVGRDGRG
jgi:hypothetical protein